jgi:GlpG protein
MRKIDTFQDENQAKSAHIYLSQHNIECELQKDDQGNFHIWIFDEDLMDKAKEQLALFKANPNQAVSSLILETTRLATEFKKKPKMERKPRKIHLGGGSGGTPVTYSIMAICIIMFLLFASRAANQLLEYFYYSRYSYPLFVEIRQGEVWRMVTPIFLHFNILHIGFNMLWFYQLGMQIELLEGSRFLTFMVLAMGVISNTIEYVIPPHNPFGGMSGVIYGMLGFVWAMGRFYPRSGYNMDNGTLWFMIIWLFLGMTGIFGPMANWCHLSGLITGLAFGYALARRRA